MHIKLSRRLSPSCIALYECGSVINLVSNHGEKM